MIFRLETFEVCMFEKLQRNKPSFAQNRLFCSEYNTTAEHSIKRSTRPGSHGGPYDGSFVFNYSLLHAAIIM